jgi:hypothetical protein
MMEFIGGSDIDEGTETNRYVWLAWAYPFLWRIFEI